MQLVRCPLFQHISVTRGILFCLCQIVVQIVPAFAAFLCSRYFQDSGPEIYLTRDGGESWVRLDLDRPEQYSDCSMTPGTPIITSKSVSFPIQAVRAAGELSLTCSSRDLEHWTWTENRRQNGRPAAGAAISYVSARVRAKARARCSFSGSINGMSYPRCRSASIPQYWSWACLQYRRTPS